MKEAIVYYSFSGNNEALAKELKRRTGFDLEKITELKKRAGFSILLDIIFKRTPGILKPKLELSQYDKVILIAPIWAGRIATPMKAFIKLEKGQIQKYSFITLCGNGGNQKVSEELSQLFQKEPTSVLELKVNDLLPENEKNRIKYTSGYRVKAQDFQVFKKEIDAFIQAE